MSNLTDKVVSAKEALVLAMGDNWQRYLANMKFWFHNKWSKEEFDFECRKLLSPDKIHLHNQFLLAILNKIEAYNTPQHSPMQQENTNVAPGNGQSQMHSTGSGGRSGSSGSNRKRKRSSRSYFERVPFEPYDFTEFMLQDNMQLIRPPSTSGEHAQSQNMPTQRYCAQELFLPDAGFLLGRFLIGAWEAGLSTVDEDVAEYIAHAVQVFLKNLITSLIMKRKNYRTTSDGNFYYDVGAPVHDPSLRNSVTRQKVDDAPLELDKEMTNFLRRSNEDNVFLAACEDVEPSERIVITLRDCQRVFRDRNLLPSHTLYAVNMERINMMLH